MQRKRQNRLVVAVALSIIAPFMVGIWFLSADARREIDALATANADSSQWGIAQAEVELLALENAVLQAQLAGPDAPLAPVRRRFDVFYARIQTIGRSELFVPVLSDPQVAEAFSGMSRFLDSTVPLIDGPDADLRAGLPDLALSIRDARFLLRSVALASVRRFAETAEIRRAQVSKALSDLALLTVALVLVLVGAVIALGVSLAIGRRRTEEIARARSRLSTVVNTSHDGVIVVDCNGRVLDINGAAKGMFGYDAAEMLGHSVADLIFPEQRREAYQAAMQTFLQDGQFRGPAGRLLQIEARDKDGRVFPAELSLSTAESDEGEIFVAFIRDISDRVAAKQALVDARDRALAGEQTKAELLAVMSHEMRTPLNGVLGGLDLLSATPLTERQKGYVDVMTRSGQMLLDHVNRVLDISREDAGKTVLHHAVFDPAQVVQGVADSQSVQAEARGNRIVVAPDSAAIGAVIGDAILLQQALVNLVANAVKFTRNGRITLSVRRLPDDPLVEFRITDTGIGIAQEDQARIFDDFVTLDTRYARDVEGTGLGLGITRRLVAAMGGEIGVESQPGAGSDFWLRLPLPRATDAVEDPADTPSTGVGPAARLRGVLSVLIVEDNDINRLILRDILADLGFLITESRDGDEGVDMATDTAFDLILMDISMPRMDGIAATRRIREGGGPNAETPIVALTAHALPPEIDRFQDAGMNEVLVKPLSRATLLALLGRLFPDHVEVTPQDAPPLAGTAEPSLPPHILSRASEELETALARMTTLLKADHDGTQIATIAHDCAGLAAVIGQSELSAAFQRLEHAVSDLAGDMNRADALGDLLTEARQIFDRGRVSGRAGAQMDPASTM